MNIFKKSHVIAKMPNAGLGNILFVWAKALIFSKSNNLPLTIIGLNNIHIGPFLRREKVKRFYFGQFKFPKINNLINSLIAQLNSKKIVEPLTIDSTKAIYIFNQIPDWSHFFKNLKPHRQLIIKEFYKLLSKKTLSRIAQLKTEDYIAVHIRMGDFKKLEANVDFKNVGATRTPFNYFKDVIDKLKQNGFENTPIKIFSDGHKGELTEILAIPNTAYMPPDIDVVDLIKISRAKLIVTSAHSTFSEWAGFLSEVPIIRHPDHIHGSIREETHLFEGIIDNYIQLLNLNTTAPIP